ncbi:MAG: MBL fold metallo-hydrolase [Gammaproteobacteria bacterium]|nr:MBL fold metallo-hydrolase [Gammaproteobacteria bacterium]
MATITFLGATGQVTGSCYLIETAGHRILLDCGMFQGSREVEQQNEQEFPFDPAKLDAVVLSHAHLDHCGRLPKLAKEGFNAPVYLTEPSFPLLELMLKDAVHLQLKDTEWENRRRERAGKELIEPLYELEDVENLLKLRQALVFNQVKEIVPGVQISFHEAGHILGSAIVKLDIREQGETKTVIFSGDLGNPKSPLLRDADIMTKADVLLMESTYGDRDHKPLDNSLEELKGVLASAADTGGNVIIPAFAIGRSQDLIYWLGKLQRQGALQQRHIYLDSPMAISASKIYAEYSSLFNSDDPEFKAIAPKGWQAWLNGLVYSETAEDSMAINRIAGGAIIIAGSGMCNGGRIRHHLKYNLWRRNAHVVITGYQAEGTLGRLLVDGKKSVIKILGSDVNVAAKIHTLGAFSAHADQSQLLSWAQHFTEPKPELYLVHGEKSAALSLQTCFKRRNWFARIPKVNDTISI